MHHEWKIICETWKTYFKQLKCNKYNRQLRNFLQQKFLQISSKLVKLNSHKKIFLFKFLNNKLVKEVVSFK